MYIVTPNTQQRSSPAPWVGDMVVIQDPELPRGFWKTARIAKLLKGKDGQCR